MYRDRQEAAEALVPLAQDTRPQRPVVLGIPRGGVPVAAVLADALGAHLDVTLARKIGSPGNPEAAIGAVNEQGEILLAPLPAGWRIPPEYVQREAERQREEIRRRLDLYRGGKAPLPLEGRTVFLVDDGIATGMTVLAAIRGLRPLQPRRILLAVPVAPRRVLEDLAEEVDEILCPLVPEPFYAVGQFYARFPQVSDEEVQDLLERYREEPLRKPH